MFYVILSQEHTIFNIQPDCQYISIERSIIFVHIAFWPCNLELKELFLKIIFVKIILRLFKCKQLDYCYVLRLESWQNYRTAQICSLKLEASISNSQFISLIVKCVSGYFMSVDFIHCS